MTILSIERPVGDQLRKPSPLCCCLVRVSRPVSPDVMHHYFYHFIVRNRSTEL